MRGTAIYIFEAIKSIVYYTIATARYFREVYSIWLELESWWNILHLLSRHLLFEYWKDVETYWMATKSQITLLHSMPKHSWISSQITGQNILTFYLFYYRNEFVKFSRISSELYVKMIKMKMSQLIWCSWAGINCFIEIRNMII